MEKSTYEKIAEWVTEFGLNGTTNGSYYVPFGKVADAFKLSIGWIRAHAEDIENCFDYDIVADSSIEGDSFGMNFYLQYCCEHCSTYINGNKCSKECCNCECWCGEEEE